VNRPGLGRADFCLVGKLLPFSFFLQALQEPNGRAEEIKTLAQLVLEEPLVAEMQALGLIGE
jgi:hypothetical protein